jgi:hypothetical protein
MKYIAIVFALVLTGTANAQVPESALLVEKIDLAKFAQQVKVRSKEKFNLGIYSYTFSIPETTKNGLARLEAHGRFEHDLDKIVMSCNRFTEKGEGPLPESIATPCGEIYAKALSAFVSNPVDFANHLMAAAKAKGKQYSTASVKIKDFLFEYSNDGMLIIRRASRTIPN